MGGEREKERVVEKEGGMEKYGVMGKAGGWDGDRKGKKDWGGCRFPIGYIEVFANSSIKMNGL